MILMGSIVSNRECSGDMMLDGSLGLISIELGSSLWLIVVLVDGVNRVVLVF